MGNSLSYSCNGIGDKLLQSVTDGDFVAVRQVLQEHSRLAFWCRLSDGTSPLHVAAVSGQLDIALRIISSARRQRHFETPREALAATKAVQNMLDTRNSLGQTPLMLACRHGRTEVVRLLLSQGADPLHKDAQSKTCLHYAAQVGWASCCAVLLADTTFYRNTSTLLRSVEVEGKDGQRRRFVDAGAHLGYTALHIAASHGHLETSKVLLKYGASLTYECQGILRTPASLARRTPFLSHAHVSPLHIAAARRNVPMCRAMLQAHALYVASSESAVGGGQPVFDIRNTRDHFEQRPVDIAEALGCAPLAAMLSPSLALHFAVAGHGFQGPLGPQPLMDLAAQALRQSLISQLQRMAQEPKAKALQNSGTKASIKAVFVRKSTFSSKQQQWLLPAKPKAGTKPAVRRCLSGGFPSSALSPQASSGSLQSFQSGHLQSAARLQRSLSDLAAAVLGPQPPIRPTFNIHVRADSGYCAMPSAIHSAPAEQNTLVGEDTASGADNGRAKTDNTKYASKSVEAAAGSSKYAIAFAGCSGTRNDVARISRDGLRGVGSASSSCSDFAILADLGCFVTHYGNSQWDARTPAASARVSGTGSADDAHECGICLDREARLRVVGCQHPLCGECAAELCKVQSIAAPACPFCRCTMGGFVWRK